MKSLLKSFYILYCLPIYILLNVEERSEYKNRYGINPSHYHKAVIASEVEHDMLYKGKSQIIAFIVVCSFMYGIIYLLIISFIK